VIRLVSAQVHGNLLLELLIDLAKEVHHHDVLGGNRAVGLELELPASLLCLPLDQRVAGRRDRLLERRPPGCIGGGTHAEPALDRGRGAREQIRRRPSSCHRA